MSNYLWDPGAIGLDFRSGEIIAAVVSMGMNLCSIHSVTEAPIDPSSGRKAALAQLIERLPGGMPVIPVVPGSLHFMNELPRRAGRVLQINEDDSPELCDLLATGPGEAIGMRSFVRNMTRNGRPVYWFAGHEQLTDIIRELNYVAKCPGAVFPGSAHQAATAELHRIPSDKNIFTIDNDGTIVRMSAIRGANIIFMRTVRRFSDGLLPEIALAFHSLRIGDPEWSPDYLCLIGKKLPDVILLGLQSLCESVQTIRIPFEGDLNKEPAGWESAAGAAISYLVNGRRCLLRSKHPDAAHRNVIGAGALLRLAAMLMVTLAAGTNLKIRLQDARSDLTNIYEQSAQTQNSYKNEYESISKLGGFSGGMYLPGETSSTIMSKIGDTIPGRGIVLDSIQGGPNLLTISGRTDEFGGLNSFVDALKSILKGDAGVKIEGTDRAGDGKIQFRIRIGNLEEKSEL
jgi:hypothetical protein